MGNVVHECCKQKILTIQVPKDQSPPVKKASSDAQRFIAKLPSKPSVSIGDFTLEAKLGQGAHGKVYKCLKNSSRKEYAIKMIKKKLLRKKIRVKDVLNEKKIMITTIHPFIVRLHFAFQDKKCLYYVMDCVNGGTISKYIKQTLRLTEESARFLCAQIVLALRYLHEEKKIVYRDLKPDNILIGEDGYIKVSDFGLSAMNVECLTSICGTYEYIAPEILNGETYSYVVDYFSLGCLLYEMLFRSSPFLGMSSSKGNGTVVKNIITGSYNFPDEPPISIEAQELISGLLEIDPKARLGAQGGFEVQNHAFFDRIEWQKLLKKELKAPMTIHPFKGFIDRKNKLNDTISETSTSLVVKGFEYENEGETSTADIGS